MASFAEALKKRLTPEVYVQVMDSLGDDFDFDLVPRARLNTVIKQRNELREKVGESLTVTDDDFTVPTSAKAPSVGAAQEPTTRQPGVAVTDALAELEKKHAVAMREMSLRYAVLDKLRAAGALDPELIYNAKLLDLAEIKDGKEPGTFEGLDTAVKALVDNKERSYLFGQVAAPAGTGRAGVSAGTPEVSLDTFKAMSYTERLQLKTDNPTTYEKLSNMKG